MWFFTYGYYRFIYYKSIYFIDKLVGRMTYELEQSIII
jgi:hypothetical protein